MTLGMAATMALTGGWPEMTFTSKWQNSAGTPTYRSWKMMRQRCMNTNAPNYMRYGGRGITICDHWRNDYDAFVADMGFRPINTTLERIDNNGNYEPANCQWATRKIQGQNRETTKYLSHGGETLSWRVWSERIGMNRETFARYARQGLTVGQIMELKIGTYRRRMAKYDL